VTGRVLHAVSFLLLVLAIIGSCDGRPLPVDIADAVVVCARCDLGICDLCGACRDFAADVVDSCPDGTGVCQLPLPDGCAVQVCSECR